MKKKLYFQKIKSDIEEDMEANIEGRDLGREYPNTNPYDLLKHRIPNGFPDRYKH